MPYTARTETKNAVTTALRRKLEKSMTQAIATVKSNVVAIEGPKSKRVLSTNPTAVRARERNAVKKLEAAEALIAEQTAKDAAERAEHEAREAEEAAEAAVMRKAMRKAGAGRIAAMLGAGFLPIASFAIAHFEAPNNPALWVLVAAALLFSAPTLVTWAVKWCGSMYKAIGFAGLLEGVMVFSHIQYLAYAGLAILVLINATNAYYLAGKAQAAEM